MIPKFDLQFFAQDSPTGQKTEKATPRRRQKAREKGQVAKSVDMSSTIVLIMGFLIIYIWGPFITERIIEILTVTISDISNSNLTILKIRKLILFYIYNWFYMVAPVLIGLAIAAFFINYFQVGGIIIATEPFKPDFTKFNPINGIKKIFSSKSLVELIKSLFKIIVVGYFPFKTIKGSIKTFILMPQMDIPLILSLTNNIIWKIIIQVCIVLLIIAFIDWAYQKWEYENSLKMSKYDIKQEMKDINGNPQIKAEQRKRARMMLMRAMMKEVPNADVVLTNPTHLAIALKYESNHPVYDAPYVIAKGAGKIAERIKEIAKENDVPVIENKPVARALYSACDVGDEIPREFFDIITEILVMVYKMKGKI